MGQRDAFGREIGEAPAPVPQDPPAPAPKRVRSAGAVARNAVSLAVTLVIVGAIAGLVILSVGVKPGTKSDASSLALPATTSPKAPTTHAAPARPKLSLISRGAMIY